MSKSSIILAESCLEVNQLLRGESQEMMGQIALQAGLDETQENAPVDITCVVDISGSMYGKKIELMKKALLQMIGFLSAKDKISIVAFDSKVHEILPYTRMNEQGKKLAAAKVKRIEVYSCTNLSGGLFKGFDHIKSRKEKNEVVSLLLFTDGVANFGITKTEELVNAIKGVSGQLGTAYSLFSFGFGNDHDDEMLKSISEVGNGLYYYVEEEEEIPKAFASCLGGLYSVVAQNISLQIKLNDMCSNECNPKIVDLKIPYKWKQLASGAYEIDIGDMYSEEKRNLLFKFSIPSIEKPNDSQEIFSYKLSYFNVLNTSLVEDEGIVYLKRPETIQGEVEFDKELNKQTNRVLCGEAMSKAKKLGDDGELLKAQGELEVACTTIEQSVTKDDEYCKGLVEDMRACLNRMKSRNTFKESGTRYMTGFIQSTMYQRSTTTKSVSQNQYSTTSKERTIRHFS